MTKQNWLERAKQRWPNVGNIHGDGCWAIAVISEHNGRTREVILCEDEARAIAASHFYDNCRRVDLSVDIESLLARIPDRYDADEARRERRERQRNA